MQIMKTTPKSEPAAADFQAACEHWAKVDGKYQEMIERRDGLALANSLTFESTAPGTVRDRNIPTPQHLRDKAAPFMKLASRRPWKLDEQRADILDEIADFAPVHQVAHEDLKAARRRETTRLAAEIQPRHKKAVLAIAKALEVLSVAIDDEIAARAELAQVGAPEHESALLPDCSGELLVGSLAEWNSPASAWARKMRKLGILG